MSLSRRPRRPARRGRHLPRDARRARRRADPALAARACTRSSARRRATIARLFRARRRAVAVVFAAGDGRRRAAAIIDRSRRSNCSRCATATRWSACSNSIAAIAGECELSFVGLVPELCRARAMAAGCSPRRWRAPGRDGTTRVHVHTCTLDHPAALAAYRRAGFVAVGAQVETFIDPRLAGILPRDAAPQIPLVEPPRQLSGDPRRASPRRGSTNAVWTSPPISATSSARHAQRLGLAERERGERCRPPTTPPCAKISEAIRNSRKKPSSRQILAAGRAPCRLDQRRRPIAARSHRQRRRQQQDPRHSSEDDQRRSQRQRPDWRRRAAVGGRRRPAPARRSARISDQADATRQNRTKAPSVAGSRRSARPIASPTRADPAHRPAGTIAICPTSADQQAISRRSTIHGREPSAGADRDWRLDQLRRSSPAPRSAPAPAARAAASRARTNAAASLHAVPIDKLCCHTAPPSVRRDPRASRARAGNRPCARRAARARRRRWTIATTSNGGSARGSTPYPDALAEMEARAAAVRAGDGARTGLAARASALVHRRHQRRPGRTVQPARLPGLRSRARRALHLSRPGPARRLSPARPRKARQATSAASSMRSKAG